MLNNRNKKNRNLVKEDGRYFAEKKYGESEEEIFYRMFKLKKKKIPTSQEKEYIRFNNDFYGDSA